MDDEGGIHELGASAWEDRRRELRRADEAPP
jgi:hypothetical protein